MGAHPTGGFADDVLVVGGRVAPTDDPRIGIERKAELYGICRELAGETVSAR